MNAAPAQDLNPPAAGSSGPALALSLLAHALLVLALAWGVNWSRTDPMVAFSAEIWAPAAEQAAPAAPAEQEPPAPPAPPAPPPPREQPAPPPPARVQQEARDAELALEKRRKEKQKAEEKAEKQAKEKAQSEKAERAEKAAKEKAAKEKAEKEKAEKDRKEKEDKQREKAKEEARKAQDRKEAAESEKRRQEQINRTLGQAKAANNSVSTSTPGATGAPEAKGTAQRSAAPSSSYAGKIAQLIKDNTKFTDPNSGRPSVVVLVRTSPQGKIDLKESKIISTSGNQAFDEAVLRGIQKMEFVPKDTDGRIPEMLLREGLELKVTL